MRSMFRLHKSPAVVNGVNVLIWTWNSHLLCQLFLWVRRDSVAFSSWDLTCLQVKRMDSKWNISACRSLLLLLFVRNGMYIGRSTTYEWLMRSKSLASVMRSLWLMNNNGWNAARNVLNFHCLRSGFNPLTLTRLCKKFLFVCFEYVWWKVVRHARS